MQFLIPFLLLFGFECSYGHTLPRKELLKNVNIYSIHENDHNALTIVNPQSKKPTVKEITYFHVIERPYEDKQVMVTHKEETFEGPDFDETRRPFTNGHGLQFSDLISEIDQDAETSNDTVDLDKENAQSSDEDLSDVKRSSEVEDDIESSDDDNESSDDDSESDDEDSEGYDRSGETSGDGEVEGDEEDVAANRDDEHLNTNEKINKLPPKTNSSKDKVVSIDSKEHKINEFSKTVEKKRSTTKITDSMKEPQTSETTTEAVIVTTKPTFVNEKRATRNMLFNQLRDRYQKSLKPASVSSRSKRYTKYSDRQDSADDKELPKIPEAPILPELDLDELPSYIRDMISSTEKSENLELEKNNDNTKVEIEHRIEEIINEALRPYEEEGDRKESQEDTPEKPRTYGMKLSRGTGHVWNFFNPLRRRQKRAKYKKYRDLWSNPGMSFDVGDSSNHSSNEKHEVNQDYEIEPYEKDKFEEMHYESSEIDDLEDVIVNKYVENNTDKPTDEKEKNRENAINYNAIKVKSEPIINYSKLEHQERHENSNLSNEKASKKRIKNYNQKDNTEQSMIDITETYDIENDIQKYTTEQSTNYITEAYDKDREPLEREKEHVTQKGKTFKDTESYQPKRIENIIEILKDQDEDFWAWLQDWTSTYMDLLMKFSRKVSSVDHSPIPFYLKKQSQHIKKIVQLEVKKQLKSNNKHYDRENSSNGPHTLSEPQKDETRIENSQVPITDKNIIVDGVKIPLTHNTNFHLNHTANDIEKDEINKESKSESLKGRRHKEKDKGTTVEVSNVESESDSKNINKFNDTDRKSMKKEQVDAKNIFGNSYNNDKVTNIYIFYPNFDLKKLIKDLNLDIGNTNTNVEKKDNITTDGKKEDSKPIKEEIVPIIDKKDEITTQITPTKEKETLQATESSYINKTENAKGSENQTNDNDKKELSQTFTESITSQSDKTKVEIEITNTTENDHDAVKSEVDGEKNDTSVMNESEVLKLGIQTVGYLSGV